jgi:hypothetical protein
VILSPATSLGNYQTTLPTLQGTCISIYISKAGISYLLLPENGQPDYVHQPQNFLGAFHDPNVPRQQAVPQHPNDYDSTVTRGSSAPTRASSVPASLSLMTSQRESNTRISGTLPDLYHAPQPMQPERVVPLFYAEEPLQHIQSSEIYPPLDRSRSIRPDEQQLVEDRSPPAFQTGSSSHSVYSNRSAYDHIASTRTLEHGHESRAVQYNPYTTTVDHRGFVQSAQHGHHDEASDHNTAMTTFSSIRPMQPLVSDRVGHPDGHPQSLMQRGSNDPRVAEHGHFSRHAEPARPVQDQQQTEHQAFGVVPAPTVLRQPALPGRKMQEVERQVPLHSTVYDSHPQSVVHERFDNTRRASSSHGNLMPGTMQPRLLSVTGQQWSHYPPDPMNGELNIASICNEGANFLLSVGISQPPTLPATWIVVGLGIIHLEGRGPPPHSYVTSIQVPDPNFVTLRAVLVRVAQEYHRIPDVHAIESGKWQTWITPWYQAITPTSNRAPWYFMDCYRAIRGDRMDMQLTTTVAHGAPGYTSALSAARTGSHTGAMYLPDGTLVYSLYFEEQVRNAFVLQLCITDIIHRIPTAVGHAGLRVDLGCQDIAMLREPATDIVFRVFWCARESREDMGI